MQFKYVNPYMQHLFQYHFTMIENYSTKKNVIPFCNHILCCWRIKERAESSIILCSSSDKTWQYFFYTCSYLELIKEEGKVLIKSRHFKILKKKKTIKERMVHLITILFDVASCPSIGICVLLQLVKTRKNLKSINALQ